MPFLTPNNPVTGLNIVSIENYVLYFHYRSKGHLHFQLETIGKYNVFPIAMYILG